MENKKLIAVAATIASLCVALPAFAQTASTTRDREAKQPLFCSKLSTVSSKISDNINARQQKITDYRAAINTKRANRWSTSNAKLAQTRSDADQRRAADYDKLMAHASTSAQQAAVTQFKSTVEAAVTARRTAIDAAIKAYRDGVDSALSDQATGLVTAESAFKSAVDAAIAKAQSDCTASASNGPAIRTALQSSIQSAQQAFKTARQDGKLEGTRQTLAATRQAAVQKAVADFEATVKQARDTLKAALKSS